MDIFLKIVLNFIYNKYYFITSFVYKFNYIKLRKGSGYDVLKLFKFHSARLLN